MDLPRDAPPLVVPRLELPDGERAQLLQGGPKLVAHPPPLGHILRGADVLHHLAGAARDRPTPVAHLRDRAVGPDHPMLALDLAPLPHGALDAAPHLLDVVGVNRGPRPLEGGGPPLGGQAEDPEHLMRPEEQTRADIHHPAPGGAGMLDLLDVVWRRSRRTAG